MSSRRDEFEILVVGAGPAGMAAACVAAEAGRQVAVLDNSPWLGGQIWRGEQAQPAQAAARRWTQRLQRSGAHVILERHRVCGADPALHPGGDTGRRAGNHLAEADSRHRRARVVRAVSRLDLARGAGAGRPARHVQGGVARRRQTRGGSGDGPAVAGGGRRLEAARRARAVGRRADAAGEGPAFRLQPLALSGQARPRPGGEDASDGRAVPLRLLAGQGGGNRTRAARHADRRETTLDRGLRLSGLRFPSCAECRVAAAAGLRTGRRRRSRERIPGNDVDRCLLRRGTDGCGRCRLRTGRRPDCRAGRRGTDAAGE